MKTLPPFEAFPQVDTGTHGGRVVQLLALKGGRVLASAGETTIRLWDMADKRPLRLLLGRVKRDTDDAAWDGKVARIAASPDGRWLVALKPWCHEPGRHPCAPEDAEVGHDAGRATEVQVFDCTTGNLQSRHLYPGQLLDLDFSPDGRRLALVANRREGRRRQAEVLLVATRDLLRPGARPAPKPLARLAVGLPRQASTLPAALRFVPGTTTLVVAVAEPWAERGQIAWLHCTPAGRLTLKRSVALDRSIGVETLAVSATLVAFGTEAPKRRSLRGCLAWFRHDGSASGTLDTEAPPASTAFSPSGHRLAVGLMVDPDGQADAASGTQVVQVNAYEVPPVGEPALRSTYYGHDDTVSALAFTSEDQVASAGGDNQALHFWSPQYRVAVQQGAIRGVGRVAYLPGITAQERVLFGTVPLRQLPPGHAPRQQSFCLHRRVLATTRGSDVRASDYVSRRWFVGDFDEAVIPLWFIGDLKGPRPEQPPPRDPDLRLFVGADDQWVLWTASGYYDAASPEAARRIGYRVNRGVAQEALLVPSDRFKAFYQPDLVAAVVRHGTEERARARGVVLPAVDVAAMLPPIVELARHGIRRHRDRVALRYTVETSNPALPPTRVTLLRNGRVVWADRAPPKRALARGEVPLLPLLPGTNRFSLHAENAQAKSVPVEFEIEGPPAPEAGEAAVGAPGRLFLLSVGVGRFADPRNKPLRFPRRDAQAVFDAIGHGRLKAAPATRRRAGNRAFDSVDARVLLDEQATKAAILAELDRMCEAIAQRHREKGAERDVLFVFLSGHGSRVYEHGTPSLYFVNHDLVPTAEDVDATGLSLLDLGERITAVAAEVVLVVDACHASLAGGGVFAGLDPEEMARRVHAIYERGLYVVSAARADELAHEDAGSRLGVLTTAVMRALREAPKGREVLMADLVTRLQRLVPEVSARAGTTPQTPVCRTYGDLVPLPILKT